MAYDKDTIRFLAVHTAPVLEDPSFPAKRRPPTPGVKTDLPVVGWCNVLAIEVNGVKRYFLHADTDEVVMDEPSLDGWGD